ncbi:MAG: LysM peptidoglycan-binding domain-containing protein [Chloroflexota bacterium]|nr:LysM peptidoglycan-binding domain-containing protein [Chloroflexota bacterium]
MHRQPRILDLFGALAAVVVAVSGALVDTTAAAEPTMVVQAGDTLSQIALEHGVTVERLAALNRIDDPNRIYAGQTLVLEIAKPVTAKPVTAKPAPSTSHLIQPGEYLIAIADHYGTTVAAIATENRLTNPSFIRAGDRLHIPGVAAPPSKPARPSAAVVTTALHVVLAGENLTGIAALYGTTIAAIAQANAIGNPSYIRAGDRLLIPGGKPLRAAAARPSAAKPRSMPNLSAPQQEVRTVIVEEARRFGVPPALALAIGWQESGWRQGVVSRAGAVGVMQLLPATGDWVAATMLHEPVRIGELRSNIRAGVRLVAHYLERYGGDRDRTLAAYYQGQRAVDTIGIYAVSWPYISSVRALEALFSGS